jgi:superfamily II DNA/RNA helicase
VDDIDLVVHVDPPTEHKTYLHRSGRTARAGAAGRVVTVVLPEQQGAVRTLLRQASVEVTPVATGPDSAHLAELRGEQAALVPYRPRTQPPQAATRPRPERDGAARSAYARKPSRGQGRGR